MAFETIQDIIANRTDIDRDDITSDTDLRKDLGVDSLDLFQIMTDVEDEFGIDIDSPGDLRTVQDLVDLAEA
ncbi:MAG: acyl carrier protein [Lachnospiraceae bacterium]|nr:acyl carrier protein [Lachnospiraceae bacterium]